MIHNLKNYKSSLLYSTHLQAILHIINLSIKGLSYYRAYTPVARILNSLQVEKLILESHYQKALKIKENKGQMNENT